MACDICGKTGTPLRDLREIYQTDQIKVMCPDCEKVVNKQLRSIQDMTTRMQKALLKLFMAERKAKKDPS
ncbi:hypothetical protein ACTJKQ_14150 [Acidovorax sp. 22279]|uniref:hypothetical protein n=1 Tax=Acidovorax sp. 22279 TaxID=3453900 RepID=UPI003F868F27